MQHIENPGIIRTVYSGILRHIQGHSAYSAMFRHIEGHSGNTEACGAIIRHI